jgi:hypothetical protein
MFKLSTSALLTAIVALNSSLVVVSSSSSSSVLHSTAGADIVKISRALNKAITNGSYDSLPSSLSAKLRSLEETCQFIDVAVNPTVEELASIMAIDGNNVPATGSSVAMDYSKAPNFIKEFGEACSAKGGDFYLVTYSSDACSGLEDMGGTADGSPTAGIDITIKDLPLCSKGCGSASEFKKVFETGANADADCKASIKVKNSGNAMGGRNAFFAIGALVATITMTMI